MTKYQEAINRLWDFVELHSNDFPKDLYDSLEDLQELVDKETPMKPPLKWEYAKPQTRCKCTAGVEKYHNYCWDCGQKLDWSDDDE